jgi:moderate conductance mechanosensitive channel
VLHTASTPATTLWRSMWVDALLGTPLKIALIVLAGLGTRFVAHRLIDRVTDGIATGVRGFGRSDGQQVNGTVLLAASAVLRARREQRARTTASVLQSLTTAVVASVVAITALDVLAIPVAPLLASAGIVGIALGIGAQSLVKDVISGLLMMVEDQYGVGDVVDLGSASGVVEAVGLRITRLRDDDGTVWYLRNGEVLRVGNHSHGWSRAVVDVGIAHGEDLDRARQLLLEAARSLADDRVTKDLLMAGVPSEPQVWGIEEFLAEGVVLRVVVQTRPLQQVAVARELRRRIKDRLDTAGVTVVYPPPDPPAVPGHSHLV